MSGYVGATADKVRSNDAGVGWTFGCLVRPDGPSRLRLDELDRATGRRPIARASARTYQERALRQLTTLAGYSDKTTIEAEIPAMAVKGQFSSKRTFSAPQSLDYTATNFVGDNFVKTNVIYRLLRSDVERVEKNTASKVAILERNYKFSYKGIRHLNGRTLYAFALKPRRKIPASSKVTYLSTHRADASFRRWGG